MPENNIHERAIVHPDAQIGENVSVGPFSIIESDVVIGDNTIIEPHVMIRGGTQIGKNNHIYQYNSIGEAPQHKGYNNEPTKLVIGDNNIIREFGTFHRGTADGIGTTTVGDNNFFMSYIHISHDCTIGNNVIFANGVSFGGHSNVDDNVVIGAFALLHQHCRVGKYSIIGGGCACRQDIAPYVMVAGSDAKTHGLNVTGLKRNGFSSESISLLRKAYKILFRSKLDLKTSVSELKALNGGAEVNSLIEFIEGSERGFIR